MVDFMKWALTDGQKFCRRARLRAAAGGRRQARDGGARQDQGRRETRPRTSEFRLGTGLFGARPRPASSRRSASSCSRQSWLSIQKFGLNFWRTTTWDPVAGQFGALPFIWGTLYSSILALLHRDADRARHRGLHLRALSPTARSRRSCSSPSCSRRFRRSCTACGASSCSCPPSARSKSAMPQPLKALPFFSGPPFGVGMLSAALILAIMVIPFTSSVAREVLKAVPMRAARRRLRARRDALRGDHAPPSTTRAPASSARSCSASAARSARRWP